MLCNTLGWRLALINVSKYRIKEKYKSILVNLFKKKKKNTNTNTKSKQKSS